MTPKDSTKGRWHAYLEIASERGDEIYDRERYKEEALAKALSHAREAVLRDDDNWPTLVTAAIKHKDNNIIYWDNQRKLADWIEGIGPKRQKRSWECGPTAIDHLATASAPSTPKCRNPCGHSLLGARGSMRHRTS